MNRHFISAKVKAGIKDRVLKDGRIIFKTLYWTRHSYAKRYLERGGNLKVLSMRMGHTSIKMTADTYGRLERSSIQDIFVPAIGQNAGQMRGKPSDFIETLGNSSEHNGTELKVLNVDSPTVIE